MREKFLQWWQKCPWVPYIFKKIPWSEDHAYVYEYTGTLRPDLVGEQLFTRGAVVNLWLQDDLPAKEEFQKIERDMSEHSFFSSQSIPRAGFRIPDSGHTRQAFFHKVGHQAAFWLKWGDNVIIKENNATIYGSKNVKYAYSVRRKKK